MALFIRHMLRRPDRDQLDDFVADFTVINCPSFKADPEKHDCRSETVIAMNFDRKLILDRRHGIRRREQEIRLLLC